MNLKFRLYPIAIAISVCLAVPLAASATTVQNQTLRAWDTYVRLTEQRIANELNSPSRFLRVDFMNSDDSQKVQAALKAGKVYVDKMKTTDSSGKDIDVPDGMIHHWYGAIFVPGIRVDPLLRWIQDYDQQHKYFKEVEQSKLLSRDGDNFRVFLRLSRTKVVTVHYNTEHAVDYHYYGSGRSSSRSVTTKIAEIDNAGTASEREMPVGKDSGFMWRLNSYWRFREQDGGVVIECESVSLSRGIPFGLGWLVGDYVESIPRESLESALTSIREGVRSRR
jgi:hypothetical protein